MSEDTKAVFIIILEPAFEIDTARFFFSLPSMRVQATRVQRVGVVVFCMMEASGGGDWRQPWGLY